MSKLFKDGEWTLEGSALDDEVSKAIRAIAIKALKEGACPREIGYVLMNSASAVALEIAFNRKGITQK